MRRILLAGTALTVFSAAPSMAQSFNPGYSSAWWAQINLTPTIEQNANGGAGSAIGVVDTGIVATNSEVKGRVSAASSCAAVTFRCSNGANDDNGHGTATASIAAGNMGNGGLMTGVASRATIVAEKVLNASGSGFDSDVANGIVKAVNSGVSVINLSLTYLSTPSVVNAINYAAANGVYVVFAGGNASAALNGGSNTTGLTTAALSHLVFAGSVSSSNKLSSFSNTPGTGSAVAGTTKDSYASLWIMAPGENIIAPGIMYGSNAYAYWTGTSMAAPIVSGAIALLETTWPVLKKNGEATQILFQSATDLGAKGVDNTFGNGLLNVAQAFQPSGTLTIAQANGKTVAVSSLSSSLLTGGALGSLSKISGQLANYTAFDAFQRNFTVNLSSLIATKPSTAASVASAAQAPVVTGTTTHFADGGSLQLTRADDPSRFAFATPGLAAGRIGLVNQNNGAAQPAAWAFELTEAGGSVIAGGSGMPGSASFADSLWGTGTRAAEESRTLGAANPLLALADGGAFTAIGTQIGAHTRLAFSVIDSQAASGGLASSTSLSNNLMGGANWTQPMSTGIGLGITTALAEHWTGGLTLNYLHERNGLLGTTYADGAGASLGGNHTSVSFGFSAAYDISPTSGLLFDASLARSDGGSVADGLVTGVSSTLSRAYGIAYVQQNAFSEGDHLSIGIRRPLTVISGSANVATSGVDAQGNPVTGTTRVGLSTSAGETDLVASYAMPWRYGISFSANLTTRRDGDNIAGNNDALALFGAQMKF